jgi:tetratricopeptide (TPR) repeat protein
MRLSDDSSRKGLRTNCGGVMLRLPKLTPAQEAGYEIPLQRAIETVLPQARHLQREDAQELRVLAVLEKGGLEAVDKIPRKISHLARMKALLKRSWQLRHENPRLMVDLAVLAAQVSRLLDPRQFGVERVADFQAQAYAELGNAFRVSDRFQEAAFHLNEARRFFESGTREEILEIRLLELEGALAADRRQFGRASEYLLKVLQFHERQGDPHLVGRTLIVMGLYAGYAFEYEKSIELLEKSLILVDAKRDPGLACAAAHNLILSLIDSGRFPEAKKLRLVHARHLTTPGGRVNEVKFRALEGRIDSGLGKYQRAEGIFREVREGYEEVGRPYLAAISCLDLSAALLAQGKAVEGANVALEAAKTFLSLKIQPEALQAVILLRNSFEMQTATLAKVEEIAGFLRRIEIDPALRFEGRAWERPE